MSICKIIVIVMLQTKIGNLIVTKKILTKRKFRNIIIVKLKLKKGKRGEDIYIIMETNITTTVTATVTKVCSRCKEEKEITEFYHNYMYKDNYSNICKKCSNLLSKEWREKNKERKKELNKRYYEKKKELFKDSTFVTVTDTDTDTDKK